MHFSDNDHTMDILIVEDNTITRVVFKKLVHTLGYTVTMCNNAETALQLCRERFFPIIILDLGLPGIDGFEFCRRLRSLPQDLYSMVLVVTAYNNPEDVQEALEAGADDYIVKPVGTELLQMRLTIMERQAKKLMQQQLVNNSAYNEIELPLKQAIERFERQYVLNTLERYQWHREQTAEALAISEKTLYRKMKQHDLLPPETEK